MAIAFARLTIHKRSQGHSTVAASAYRSGTKLFDERTAETYNYRNRKDVAYTEIYLPEGSDNKFSNREHLWNQAELAEKRKDAQIAKEMTLALPRKLSLPHQIALTKQFTYEHFVQHGLATEIAIHDNGSGNPHAHILISMLQPIEAVNKVCRSKTESPALTLLKRKDAHGYAIHAKSLQKATCVKFDSIGLIRNALAFLTPSGLRCAPS